MQGRSIGSLQGEFSTPEEKTYPRIAIRGYSGDAIVVVSCVTSEKPYKVNYLLFTYLLWPFPN